MYVQSDALLLADVFENFQKMCRNIYKLDSTHYLSSPGFAGQAVLRKYQSKNRLFNWSWYVNKDWNRY